MCSPLVGVVEHYRPRGGTRQGDTLSPTLLALVVSFVVHPLRQRFPSVWVMLYADDLLLFFEGPPSVEELRSVFDVLRDFGDYSGMRINFSKTAAVVKNTGSAKWIEALWLMGVIVRHFVRYLGIRLGNVVSKKDLDRGLMGLTVDHAFASALTEALCRARSLTTLHLTLGERVFMLRAWIHPIVALVSKAYCPTA